MRFSEREGAKSARTTFQVDSVDEPLRNSLWNMLHQFVIQPSLFEQHNCYAHIHKFKHWLWAEHYQCRLDQAPENVEGYFQYAERRVFKGAWYEIYDLIEFCLNNFPFFSKIDDFRKACNYWLEREMSAWRIVGNQIARLTSPEEIEAVEATQVLTGKYEPVSTHIATALKHLSDRQSPDYRNSIKEAISAVESMCRIITNEPKATLGDALKKLETEGIKLHPALKLAFDKLYGYTSDQGGIRHSLLEQSSVDFEDAKFMLVSCSAFLNLLKARLN